MQYQVLGCLSDLLTNPEVCTQSKLPLTPHHKAVAQAKEWHSVLNPEINSAKLLIRLWINEEARLCGTYLQLRKSYVFQCLITKE